MNNKSTYKDISNLTLKGLSLTCLVGVLVSLPLTANSLQIFKSQKPAVSQVKTPIAEPQLTPIEAQIQKLAKDHPHLDPDVNHPQDRVVKAWIQTLAAKHNIPKYIALALCAHESGNWHMWKDHTPISNANFSPEKKLLSQDWGAMQLNDKAHPEAFPRAKEDLRFHLDYALTYLSKLHQHTKGSLNMGFGEWDQTLAAYNLGHIPTQNELSYAKTYVSKVVERVKRHRLHPTLTYTVQPGDTLSTLAQRHLKSGHWSRLMTLNKLTHPQQLRAGNDILIPII